MAEMQKPVESMTEEELRAEVASLRSTVVELRAMVARRDATIDGLQAKARQYFRAASDYLPPPEDDYGR